MEKGAIVKAGVLNVLLSQMMKESWVIITSDEIENMERETSNVLAHLLIFTLIVKEKEKGTNKIFITECPTKKTSASDYVKKP